MSADFILDLHRELYSPHKWSFGGPPKFGLSLSNYMCISSITAINVSQGSAQELLIIRKIFNSTVKYLQNVCIACLSLNIANAPNLN